MADTKITGLTALGTTPASGDLLVIVDVSDNTMDAAGTDKKITTTNAFAGLQPIDATLTAFAGLTIAANSITVGTGADAFSQTAVAANQFLARSSAGNIEAKSVTDFALSVLDDANAATARTTLGTIASGDELLEVAALTVNSDLATTHIGQFVVCDGTFTLTINAQASTAYADNFECVLQINSGILTIVGENASGAPLVNGDATTTVKTGGGLVMVKRVAEDEWIVSPREPHVAEVVAFGPGQTVVTGDGAAGFAFRVPASLDNWVLSGVAAHCETAGNGNTIIQLRNATAAVDMLSTRITLGNGETDSTENAAQPEINTSNDVVSTGDKIYFDFDSVAATPPEVVVVTMEFQ